MMTIITAGIAFLKVHVTEVATGAIGTLAGVLAHAFGPELYKAAGDWLVKQTAAFSAMVFGRMVKPDISDPDDARNVSEIAKNAIEMAERHLGSWVEGKAKMKWVLDLICSKTGLDRGEAGIIAQRVYDTQKAAAAAAVGMPLLPAPAIPAVK